MIKLVAFDWNGTLIADSKAIVDSCNIELKEVYKAGPITLKTYREVFDIPINQFLANLGISPQLVAERSKEAADVFHKVYEKKVQRCRTRKNVKKILKWLQENKIKSVIVSNHDQNRIKEQAKRLKIDSFINQICGNDHIYAPFTIKGKEKRLIDYLKKNKIESDEVLLIGDAKEDIEIGKDMGATTIALLNGQCSTQRLKAARPDYLINNLEEFIGIIKKLNAPLS